VDGEVAAAELPPQTRGLHSLTSELNLRTFGDTSLTLELNLSIHGWFGLFGGQSKLNLSGKGQSKLKLSGNGNECKPLPQAVVGAQAQRAAAHAAEASHVDAAPGAGSTAGHRGTPHVNSGSEWELNRVRGSAGRGGKEEEEEEEEEEEVRKRKALSSVRRKRRRQTKPFAWG